MRRGLRAHGHVPLRTVNCLSPHVSVSLLLGMVGEGEKDGWELENPLDVGSRTAAALFTVGSSRMVTITGRPQGAKVRDWESAKGNPNYSGILQAALVALGSGRSLLTSDGSSFSPLGS